MNATLWRRMNAHRDHRWAQSRFSDYVDGDLPQRQERRLAAHEEICPDCGRVARTLRRMLALLPGMRPAADPELAERTTEGVATRIEDTPQNGD
ncbi:MAG: zf-HC2 domain-containing protein [Solirubrobacterales bacterium]